MITNLGTGSHRMEKSEHGWQEIVRARRRNSSISLYTSPCGQSGQGWPSFRLCRFWCLFVSEKVVLALVTVRLVKCLRHRRRPKLLERGHESVCRCAEGRTLHLMHSGSSRSKGVSQCGRHPARVPGSLLASKCVRFRKPWVSKDVVCEILLGTSKYLQHDPGNLRSSQENEKARAAWHLVVGSRYHIAVSPYPAEVREVGEACFPIELSGGHHG